MSCDHAEKPMEKVGEPKGPRKVPTFEENVGVPELVETNECINWKYSAVSSTVLHASVP